MIYKFRNSIWFVTLLWIVLSGCATSDKNIPVNYDFTKASNMSIVYGRLNLTHASGLSVSMFNLDNKKVLRHEVVSNNGIMEMDTRDFAIEIEPGNWKITSISKRTKMGAEFTGFLPVFANIRFIAEPSKSYFIGDVNKDSFDLEMKLAYPSFDPLKTVNLVPKKVEQ